MIPMKKKFLFPAFVLFALAVVACGGGGGSSSVGGSSPVVPAQGKVAVKLVLHVPTKVGQMTPKLRARMNQAQSTQGLNVVVYPNPTTTAVPITSEAYDISSGLPLCSVSATDQSRTCNLSINLDPGAYIFDFASYDQAPTTAGPQGTQIGIGVTTVSVTAGQSNPVPVALSINGIASSVVVALPVPNLKPLVPVTENAIVSVLDADKDVIVSPNYADSLGNTVTVSMAVSPANLVTLGSTSFNGPLAAGVPVIYNPAIISATQMTQSNSWSITATLNNNLATGSATLAASPALSSVGIAAPSYGIANEGNNYVWVTEPLSNQIQKITPLSNAVATPITVGGGLGISGSTPGPRDIVYDPLTPGGALWMTFFNSASLATISDTGTGLTGALLSNPAQSIALDTAYNVWTVEPLTGVVDWSPATSISVTPFNPGGGTVANVSAGPGGDMYATYMAAGTAEIEALKTSGALGPFGLPTATGGSSLIGYDGNNTLYVVQPASHQISIVTGSFPTQGAASFSLGTAAPNALVEGPDGNMWFDSTSPSPEICTVSNVGVATCYPLPVGMSPGQMVVFFNQIWITDNNNPTLRVLNL